MGKLGGLISAILMVLGQIFVAAIFLAWGAVLLLGALAGALFFLKIIINFLVTGAIL